MLGHEIHLFKKKYEYLHPLFDVRKTGIFHPFGICFKNINEKDHNFGLFIMCFNHHKNDYNCTVIYFRVNHFCH